MTISHIMPAGNSSPFCEVEGNGKKEAGFGDLQPETIAEIFAKCTLEDLNVFAQVCKKWRGVACDRGDLWLSLVPSHLRTFANIRQHAISQAQTIAENEETIADTQRTIAATQRTLDLVNLRLASNAGLKLVVNCGEFIVLSLTYIVLMERLEPEQNYENFKKLAQVITAFCAVEFFNSLFAFRSFQQG